MSPMYKAVLFDLGYTLVSTNREEKLQTRLRGVGVDASLEEIARAYHLVDKYFMRELPGQLGRHPSEFMDDYWRMLMDQLGIDEDVTMQMPWDVSKVPGKDLGAAGTRAGAGAGGAAGEGTGASTGAGTNAEGTSEATLIEESARGSWALIPGADKALLTLRECGMKVGLVSNWNLTARDVLASCNLTNLFDTIVISSEVGVDKPNPDIFHEALRRLEVAPGEALYVGDNYYDDIVGAKRVGMDGMLINRFGRFGIEEIEGCPVFPNVMDMVESMGLLAQRRSR